MSGIGAGFVKGARQKDSLQKGLKETEQEEF